MNNNGNYFRRISKTSIIPNEPGKLELYFMYHTIMHAYLNDYYKLKPYVYNIQLHIL